MSSVIIAGIGFGFGLVLMILLYCVVASTPREPWEDEEQAKFLEEWKKKRNREV